ncbi:MAG: pectate lyase, partial [Candidatus Helarchaeota archaeon]|nr:pectate lyase [Candidatus Helarchaeota archaeon]
MLNLLFFSHLFAEDKLIKDALYALEKGIKYFHSISTDGGYLWEYSVDLKERWGEGEATDTQIWVQPPGTPSVGEAFLRAYKVTGERFYLSCAEDAADALIWGQKKPGGWEYKIDFKS